MALDLNGPARLAARPDTQAAYPALSGRWLFWARVTWFFVVALTVVFFSASIPAQYEQLSRFAVPHLELESVRADLEASGISAGFYATYLLMLNAVSAVVWLAVGVVIFAMRSDDRIALLTSLALITFGAFTINDAFLVTVGPAALAEQYPAARLPIQLLGFCGSVLVALFAYLFPDGRFVPRWTAWIAVLWAAHEVGYYLFPNSPLNLERLSPLLDLAFISIPICVAVGSQLYRYRYVSYPLQRQQTKWVVLGVALAGLGVLGFTLPLNLTPSLVRFGTPYELALQTGAHASMLLIPLTIGVAVVRYRLWEIDVVINRTLVYGALTASVVGLYALLVGSLGALLQARGSFPIALLSTGLIAVIFQPLRDRLQRGVNRLMYGERDDPYGVLSRLGRRLEATIEPEAVLPAIVETVAGALKLPHAEIAVLRKDGYETAASQGAPSGEPAVLPLVYGGRDIGRLVLSPRSPGEPFTPRDRRLLEDLARSAEVAVHAVGLTADLQRSRERLVTTREEERLRLRRDLHDGLGPRLAGLSFGLDAARNLLSREPEGAHALLAQLKVQAQEALSDVRRLVYGLRPPALDQLGLVVAIREGAANHGRLPNESGEVGRAGGKTTFRVEAPDRLPELPAAVEVACYRIALEAVTNVSRHAGATRCAVRLSVEDRALRLEVLDDGTGLPVERREGVGLGSMRERAAELGGACVVGPGPEGGTRVLARLPLPISEEEGSRG